MRVTRWLVAVVMTMRLALAGPGCLEAESRSQCLVSAVEALARLDWYWWVAVGMQQVEQETVAVAAVRLPPLDVL